MCEISSKLTIETTWGILWLTLNRHEQVTPLHHNILTRKEIVTKVIIK